MTVKAFTQTVHASLVILSGVEQCPSLVSRVASVSEWDQEWGPLLGYVDSCSSRGAKFIF